MRARTSDGVTPPPPQTDDPVAVDEGPMRRELLRQIEQLEQSNTRFVNDNCPWEPVATSPRRGPAILPTAALEQIRDELVAARAALHERIVARAGVELEEPRSRPRPLARLLARLRGRRLAP